MNKEVLLRIFEEDKPENGGLGILDKELTREEEAYLLLTNMEYTAEEVLNELIDLGYELEEIIELGLKYGV